LGQNQKKKNLKGLYENIEGQTQISRRKERKKKKEKEKGCRQRIKGLVSTCIVQREKRD
jgi:hypothetical protein